MSYSGKLPVRISATISPVTGARLRPSNGIKINEDPPRRMVWRG